MGAGGTAVPPPSSIGAGGARISLQTELFPTLLSSQGAFSGILDSLVQEISLEQAPDPQITVVLLGDQYIKLRSSGKESKSTHAKDHIYT